MGKLVFESIGDRYHMYIYGKDHVQVGPRDGLQNEKTLVPTDVKVEFIRLARNTTED